MGGYRIPGGDWMKWILGGGSSASGQGKEGGKGRIRPAMYAETETGAGTGTAESPEPNEQTRLLSTSESSGGEIGVHQARNRSHGIPLVGAGISTFWHTWQLSRMGRGLDPDMAMTWLFGGVIWEMVICGIFGAIQGIFQA